jgi:hypothetical protein
MIAALTLELKTTHKNMSKTINTLSVDTTDMPQSGQRRQFTITGDSGAKFMVIISSETTHYNFVSRTFQTASNAETVLKGTLPQSGRFNSRVVFPSGSGVNYNIVVMADPADDTIVAGDVLNKRISQVADTTVTFAVASTANSTFYKTFPSSVVVTTLSHSSVTANIDWNIENAETDAGGFGLLIANTLASSNAIAMLNSIYFTNTTTVDGAITSSTEVTVDSLTQIAIGSVVTGVSSGSLSGNPTVTAIDTESKTLTLSSAQTFADGITLTFKTYGKNGFTSAGITGVASEFNITPNERIEKIIAAGGSGTTINLKGTYGVGGGNRVIFSGPGVDTSGNEVVSVSASSTAGSITVSGSQSLTTGVSLGFRSKDATQTLCNAARFVGSIEVAGVPPINTTMYLDVDLLFTRLLDA